MFWIFQNQDVKIQHTAGGCSCTLVWDVVYWYIIKITAKVLYGTRQVLKRAIDPPEIVQRVFKDWANLKPTTVVGRIVIQFPDRSLVLSMSMMHFVIFMLVALWPSLSSTGNSISIISFQFSTWTRLYLYIGQKYNDERYMRKQWGWVDLFACRIWYRVKCMTSDILFSW